MIEFKEKLEEIDLLLKKRQHRWNPHFSPVSFDDVCQIIKIHLFNKWSQWNQTLPFANWANKVISNQIFNIRRNNYGNSMPPCFGCKFNIGDNLCAFTDSGEKDSQCKEYGHWEENKKPLFQIRNAYPIENHVNDKIQHFEDNLDLEEAFVKLTRFIKKELNYIDFIFFDLKYVQNKSNKEIRKVLDIPHKQMEEKDKTIICLVKEIMKKEDLFF